MQSIAPHIIKHFIPYEFSKNVLDFEVVPKKVASQKDENPLQNMKLKNLQKQSERQLVLTYKNKSNALYRSRKTVNYQSLFRKLEEEQHKLTLIKQKLQQAERKNQLQEQQIIRRSKGSVNELCLQNASEVKERDYHSARKLHTEQMKRKVNISNRGQTADGNRKRPLTHRFYSNSNFRDYSQRIFNDYAKNSELQQSPLNMANQSVKKLKIRGRQAPERQMIDHLKRASTTSDLIISINRFEKG